MMTRHGACMCICTTTRAALLPLLVAHTMGAMRSGMRTCRSRPAKGVLRVVSWLYGSPVDVWNGCSIHFVGPPPQGFGHRGHAAIGCMHVCEKIEKRKGFELGLRSRMNLACMHGFDTALLSSTPANTANAPRAEAVRLCTEYMLCAPAYRSMLCSTTSKYGPAAGSLCSFACLLHACVQTCACVHGRDVDCKHLSHGIRQTNGGIAPRLRDLLIDVTEQQAKCGTKLQTAHTCKTPRSSAAAGPRRPLCRAIESFLL